MHSHLLALVLVLAPATFAGDEFQRLVPKDSVGQPFGYALDLDGGLAVVGAPVQDGMGAAFVFDAGTGFQITQLVAPGGAPDDGFGRAVAIDGQRVLVGAPFHDGVGPNSGAAYLFDASTGQRLHKFVPTDAHKQDHFGLSVAISGDLALIGAPYDNAGAKDSGSAYVFDCITGQQVAKLLPSDAQEKTFFGGELDIDGGVAIVGQPNAQVGAAGSAGAVYVFDAAAGTQLRKLVPDDSSIWMSFGSLVDLDGSTAAISAPGDWQSGPSVGSVYVMDVLTGEQRAKFRNPYAGDDPSGFGIGVALDGDVLAIGDFYDSGDALFGGMVQLVDWPTGRTYRELRMPTPLAADYFGRLLSLQGGRLLTGIKLISGKAGEVYVVDVDGDAVGVPTCGPAIPNSTGQSATIGAQGSPVVDDNALRLEASQMPTDRPVLFLNSRSPGSSQPPGSQGKLCLGFPGRHVEQLRDSGSAGMANLLLDLSSLPTPLGAVPVQPGETWHFQAWFRDDDPLPTSNFTDAVRVTFR